MLTAEKKKLIALGLLIILGIPGAFVIQKSLEKQPATEYEQSEIANFKADTTVMSHGDVSTKTEDEIEPKYVAINKSTEHLAAQILAGSSNQVEALLNEGVKQSNRLATTVLQNKNIQVQIASADLAIKKSELEKIQTEGAIEKEKAMISEEAASPEMLLPPPVATVNIPDDVQNVESVPEEKNDVTVEEKIYEEFFVKGVTSDGVNFAAVGSFRGKTVVLRVGSVIGGTYRVISISETSLMLEKSGKTFEFTVNV